jgi:hypothetical protein
VEGQVETHIIVELSAYKPNGQAVVHTFNSWFKKEGISIGQIGTHLPVIGYPMV